MILLSDIHRNSMKSGFVTQSAACARLRLCESCVIRHAHVMRHASCRGSRSGSWAPCRRRRRIRRSSCLPEWRPRSRRWTASLSRRAPPALREIPLPLSSRNGQPAGVKLVRVGPGYRLRRSDWLPGWRPGSGGPLSSADACLMHWMPTLLPLRPAQQLRLLAERWLPLVQQSQLGT